MRVYENRAGDPHIDQQIVGFSYNKDPNKELVGFSYDKDPNKVPLSSEPPI